MFKRQGSLLFILALTLALTLSLGCAAWKTKATITYEGTGQILTSVQTGAKMLCDTGQLQPADCEKLKATYNKARAVYITAGDLLIASMNIEATLKDTTDAVKKQDLNNQLTKLMADYTANLNEAGRLVAELQDLYLQLGGK